MPTPSQTSANRRNALQSTGPRTPQGKAMSSRNSLAHGLASEGRMLPGESPADVFVILEQLRAEFRPATLNEEILIDRMACAYYRLRRCSAWEAGAIRLRMELNPILERLQKQGEQGPENFALLTDASNANLLPKLDRHEETLRREYDRCLRQLKQIQADRQHAPTQPKHPKPKNSGSKPKTGGIQAPANGGKAVLSRHRRRNRTPIRRLSPYHLSKVLPRRQPLRR